MFGYFERVGDATIPVPHTAIHHLMRDGERFREGLTGAALVSAASGAALVSAASGAALVSAGSGAPKLVSLGEPDREDLRHSRAEEDAEAARVTDEPHLIVQAWQPVGFSIKDIHGQFRQSFLSPPQIRPQGGFNIDFGQGAEVLNGGGLRKTRTGIASLSVLPDGLVTLIVGRYFLGWAMESRSWGRELINPIPLVEFVYEFCRFVSTYVRDASGGSDVTVQARLRRLDVEGPRRLAAGGLDPLYGSGGSNLPGGSVAEIVMSIARVYRPPVATVIRPPGQPVGRLGISEQYVSSISSFLGVEQRAVR